MFCFVGNSVRSSGAPNVWGVTAKGSPRQVRRHAHHTARQTYNPSTVAWLLTFVISHRPTVSQEHLALLPPSVGSKTILLSASRSKGGPWASSVWTRSTLQLDCPGNRSKVPHVEYTHGIRLNNNVDIIVFLGIWTRAKRVFYHLYTYSRPARVDRHASNIFIEK